MTAPIVLGPGDGESAAVGPIGFTIKATGEDTNGMYSLVEANGPTFATPHVHHDREEAFYVVEGTVTFLAGEDTVTAGAGSYLLVPRETMHGFRSEATARSSSRTPPAASRCSSASSRPPSSAAGWTRTFGIVSPSMSE